MLLSTALLVVGGLTAQDPGSAWADDLAGYWAGKEAVFQDPARSPLPEDARPGFTHIPRFSANPAYLVTAKCKPFKGKDMAMPTTTDRLPIYRKVATLHFTLNGTRHRLSVFQNRDLVQQP
jgi:uncharacterized protein (DUF1684 family)